MLNFYDIGVVSFFIVVICGIIILRDRWKKKPPRITEAKHKKIRNRKRKH
jgi:hypothetical protein